PYQPADSGAELFEREHLARGVGQAPGCLVRRGMWGFVELRAPTDHFAL
ncbi:hypothetical protein Ctob_014606, partial [Chrysochromulina tobinii]